MRVKSTQLKEINTYIIRDALKTKLCATTHDLSQSTGLSSVTVNNILRNMVKNGEVKIDKELFSNGGRPAQLYYFDKEHSYALVIYTYEKNHITTGYIHVVNLLGESVYSVTIDNIDIHTFQLEALVPHIDAALARFGAIKVIGFGMAAMEHDGRLFASQIKSLDGVQLLQFFRERYAIDMYLENDVNVAVLGYCRRNHILDDSSAAYIFFPEGHPPGCGLYIGGRLHRGYMQTAGRMQPLPFGVKWYDSAWYEDFDLCCATVTQAVNMIGNILNPERIVFSARFLTEAHLERVMQQSKEYVLHADQIQFALSEDMVLDYKEGMVACALDWLEKRPYIANRAVSL